MRLLHLVSLIGVLAGTQSAFGGLVFQGSAIGSWVNTVGTATISNQDAGGVAQLNWGTAVQGSFTGQFTFDGAGSDSGDASWSAASETPFSIGSFAYRNGTVYAVNPQFTATDLAIALTVTDPLSLAQTFTFHLALTEVPNTTGDPVLDGDFVTVANPASVTAFSYAGNAYTLQILGFSQDGGTTITNTFLSPEGSTANAEVYARITSDLSNQIPSSVPEPTTALFGLAIGSVCTLSRRRNRH